MAPARQDAVAEPTPGVPGRPLVLVAAVARNGVIGVDNTLPWRLGSDLKRFRAITSGNPVIMGRKTFESLPPAVPGKGGRLPGRPLVVLGRSPFPILSEDGEVARAGTLAAAIAIANALAARDGSRAIAVIGGGDIFVQTLPLASRLHITWVEAEPEGDVVFPAFDTAVFRETRREEHAPGPRDDHAFVYVDYERQIPVPVA